MLRLTADREVASSTSDAASVAASSVMVACSVPPVTRAGGPVLLHSAPAMPSSPAAQREPVSIGVVAPTSAPAVATAAEVRTAGEAATPVATDTVPAVSAGSGAGHAGSVVADGSAGSREESSGGLPAEFGVISELLRVAQRMRSALNQELADSGLNEVRLTVMQVLHSSPAGCSQSELADALQQSESSVSTLVERMRTDGLLYRLRSSSDRRKRVLMLTAEGRDRLDQVHATHGPRIGELLAGLSASDVPQLQQLLAAVDAGLDGQSLQVPMTPAAQAKPAAA